MPNYSLNDVELDVIREERLLDKRNESEDLTNVENFIPISTRSSTASTTNSSFSAFNTSTFHKGKLINFY